MIGKWDPLALIPKYTTLPYTTLKSLFLFVNAVSRTALWTVLCCLLFCWTFGTVHQGINPLETKPTNLIWRVLTLRMRSECPAEYCSITSLTSYGFSAFLNRFRALIISIYSSKLEHYSSNLCIYLCTSMYSYLIKLVSLVNVSIM